MILIIPLGGLGTRFKKLGYTKPKTLINVMGKPIIYWLLDNLDLKNINKILIPYNAELANFRFESRLKKDYPELNFVFIKLNKNTDGAAETIKIALDPLENNNLQDEPILCVDGDNFFTDNITKIWNGDNCIILFHDNSQEEIYSYAKVQDGKIIEVKEKSKISNLASTGAYGFNSWKNLKRYCEKIISANIRQKNEYYTSTVIGEMINDGHIFVPKVIMEEDFICLGTPLHVRIFCNNYPKINALNHKQMLKSKRYCFDLDNTLVSYPQTPGDYTTAKPIDKNINMLRYLKKLGNEIIIYTARRMKTHGGDRGKVMADIGKITFDTLEKFNIPYDEIYFGKPHADFYIDDLAISSYDNLEKELGFYQTTIDPRDFNRLSTTSIQLYKKESDDLSGEIFFYQNIPHQIKDMFPIMLNCDTEYKWYDMEKINGIPISKLYLAEELTIEQLDHIVGSINRIHACPINEIDNNDINIYSNYASKLIERYLNFDYSDYTNCDVIYNSLLLKLKEYEDSNKGNMSVIHGDTVLTNIIINNFGKIKFIDMRGKLGNKLTILGDQLYDWAKLYQSLIGYDEILEETKINNIYKNNIINHFKIRFMEIYGEDYVEYYEYLKIITASLIFTLIPLHNNEKCFDYYKLIDNIL